MKNIVVKSGVRQLRLFDSEGYQYYEAYLDGTEHLPDLLDTPMNLLSLHMPGTVQTAISRVSTDFCDAGEAGNASFRKLQELTSFANMHNVKYIVLHLGFFNSFAQNRYGVLDMAARRFRQFDSGNVKLCVENVPCWTNLAFEHEPVISTEEHLAYLRQHCPTLGVVLDTDHLAITTVFGFFYDTLRTRFVEAADKSEFRKGIEKTILEATHRDPGRFGALIDQSFRKFFSAVRPDIVHAVGSDYFNYRFIDDFPLVGEALPLQFYGKIKGYTVQDRLNHLQWLSLLPSDVAITLELHIRPEYDYCTKIMENYTLIEKFIRQ